MDAGQIAIQAFLVIIGTLIIGSICIFIFFKIRDKKRYDTNCIILEKCNNNLIHTKDIAGIYVDNKTNNKRFFLKSNNVGLNPDNVPFIIDSTGKKTVFLYKFGLKNFQYININADSFGALSINVGEEDVNWGINAYEKQKKIFGTTLLEKLLPYIGIALMGLFILGMIVVIMRDIKELMPLMKDLAEALKQTAIALAQANSGTTVIPS